MKPRCLKVFGLFRWLILLLIFTCLQSCDTYNFSQPQPVNKVNLQEFPKDFRGNWIADNDDEYVQIGKRSVTMIQKVSKAKIVTGAWPRLNKEGTLVYPPFYNSGLQTIRYDSLNRPIDTLNNFLLRPNAIYHINAEGLLDNGYSYRLDDDTINIAESDTVVIDLGRNAFLRKLRDGFYVLNISNALMEGYFNSDKSNWWQLVLLEQRNDDQIFIWYWTNKLIQQPAMFYTHEDTYYFDCRWTEDDLMQLIKEGNFQQGDQLRRVTGKGDD
jgi:hypothetical protein